ncbi:MAG: efflux RND transporter permease subunit [Rhizobacter sp.]|nr:efflux RND transporter permease subunit [Chlorobiales bacterium]
MIEKIIELSVRNRFVVIAIYLAVIGAGIYAVRTMPVDAIPDLSENQVIVFTEWMGQSPKRVEDQLTYPITKNLQGLPKVKAVRSQTMFGMSFVYVIFEDNTDVYWARARVSERLTMMQSQLPRGVVPAMGPDGTGVGHIFWYYLKSRTLDLAELRAIQDYYLKVQLSGVQGVAEVASAGGMVREYQIDIDQRKLLAYGLTFEDVAAAVQRSNAETGGNNLELSGAEYFIRGTGYLRGLDDLENIPVKASASGVPVRVKDVAAVQQGGATRRGVLEAEGEGEVAGGIVVMRYGENAKAVADRIKEKLAELKNGLPQGVEVVTAYDRSDLTDKSIATLQASLLEEGLVVAVIVFLFLLHVRSALRVLIEIPVSILISFALMRYFGVSSNIMSLGGLMIAIGVLVDGSIVMVENDYRNIALALEKNPNLAPKDYILIAIKSCQQVGRAIFFSLSIIIISFLPVFLLTGQEGKLFTPLVLTKTFALIGSALITISLVPVLMTFFMRGKFRPESENPTSKFFHRFYDPMLRWALSHKALVLSLNIAAILLTIPVVMQTGSEFMPPLDEGSLLFMPTLLPDASLAETKRVMQVQDKILKAMPEVKQVLGKAGKAETATDNAPVQMIETLVLLKDKREWRAGMTKEKLISEMNAQLQIAGVSNIWTQPIINRINMLATGVRTDIGLKFFGENLDTLEHLAVEAENILRGVRGAADVYAERTQGGRYLDIAPKVDALARYGLQVGDIQAVIGNALGGETLTMLVDGRRRFPVRLRLQRSDRQSIESLENILVSLPMQNTSAPAASNSAMNDNAMNGINIAPAAMSQPAASVQRMRVLRLAELADIAITGGPSMISGENGLLRSIVYLNVRGRDLGGFMGDAKQAIDRRFAGKLPQGVYYTFSGEYENKQRAEKTLLVIVPIALVLIFLMLYFIFKNFLEAGLVMLSVPFALIGGVVLVWLLGYNFSVAVWVGFLSLYGVAVETGVVMVIYLHEALDKRLIAKGSAFTEQDIVAATFEGALLRLRPKIMTVAVNLFALVPIMWASGTGSDLARPVAVPMLGGILTSAIHVLFVTPIIFVFIKTYLFRKGKLAVSDMAKFMVH